jgi:hypothetical protein
MDIGRYKNGQIIAILQIIKMSLYREFLQFIKTAKLLQFCKLQFIKRPNYCNFANYKNSPL